MYIVHSCTSVYAVGEEPLGSLLLSFFLSRECFGDLHEIGDRSAGRRVYADLSLEWKSRIEIFSSAQAVWRPSRTRVCARFSHRVASPIDTFSCILEYAPRKYTPKNIGLPPPPPLLPVSEISANLMRRTEHLRSRP